MTLDERRDVPEEERRSEGWVRLFFSAVVMGLLAWLVGRRREKPLTPAEAQYEEERKFRRLVLHGWLVVCGIAAAFVLYGLFAFFFVGDKGPPDWDFGAVPDIPGESIYSTYPYRGRIPGPEPQHVAERPQKAEVDISTKDGPVPPSKRPE